MQLRRQLVPSRGNSKWSAMTFPRDDGWVRQEQRRLRQLWMGWLVTRATWTIPLLLGSLLLSGCAERFGEGPAAISRDGTDFLLATCTVLDSPEIYGEFKTEKGWSTFIELKSTNHLPKETVLRTSQPIEGVSGTFDRFSLEGISAFAIKFEGEGPDQSVSSTFESNRSLVIPDEGWLHTDGRVTSTPCE